VRAAAPVNDQLIHGRCLRSSPDLIPLKCDDITKELSLFGGRVGFLAFGVSKDAAAILVEKGMGPMRARIGSPNGLAQNLTEIELAGIRLWQAV